MPRERRASSPADASMQPECGGLVDGRKSIHPSARVVALDTTADVVREVLEGQDCTSTASSFPCCSAAVLTRAEWEEIEGQRKYNPGCDAGNTEKKPRLRRSGDALLEVEAGFAGKLCG